MQTDSQNLSRVPWQLLINSLLSVTLQCSDSSGTFPALHLESAIFPRSSNFPLMKRVFQNNLLSLGMPLIRDCFWAFSVGRAGIHPGFLLSLYHSTVVSPSFHAEYNVLKDIGNDRIIIFHRYVFAFVHANNYLFFISYDIICCVYSLLCFFHFSVQSKKCVFFFIQSFRNFHASSLVYHIVSNFPGTLPMSHGGKQLFIWRSSSHISST